MKNNKNKVIYLVRFIFSLIVFVLSFLCFTTEFYFLSKIFYLQIGPTISSLLVSFSVSFLAVLLSVLILTFLFGRFYCSLICPLGILQDLLLFLSLKRSNANIKFNKIRYLILAIVFGALFAGWSIGFRFVEPYTNFGIIASFCSNLFNNTHNYPFFLFVLYFIPFIILILLIIFKRRIFCTTFCPTGIFLGLFSKFGIYKLEILNGCIKCGTCVKKCPTGSIDLKNKFIDNETCVRCLRCISSCPNKSIKYLRRKKRKNKFSISRRNFVVGSTLILAGVTIGVGSAISKGKLFLKNKIRALLPPGAKNYGRFYSKCTNCQLCVASCPTKVIHSKDFTHATVYMNYKKSYCKYDCNICTSVCPTDALIELTLEEKQVCRIGLAKINRKICSVCGICTTKCPVKALTIVDNKLQYNASFCIGCGACQVSCIHKAIEIVPIVEQSKAIYNS